MTLPSRPRIRIPMTPIDLIMESAGWTILIILWVITLSRYELLPETIPTHFNAAGEPDSYGRKATLLILPALGTILFISMTVLNRFPHRFNYPTTITPENALRQYTIATSMIRYLKLAIVVVFLMIVVGTIRTVSGNASGLGAWFLPLFMGMIFLPIGCFLIISLQNTK